MELVRAIAADPKNHETLRPTRTLLPIGDIRVIAHEPVLTSSTDAHSLLYRDVQAIPNHGTVEGRFETRARYYMGILPPNYTGDAAGMRREREGERLVRPARSTMAHELGHNLSPEPRAMRKTRICGLVTLTPTDQSVLGVTTSVTARSCPLPTRT